jgi:hypothetical protein
MMSDYDQAIVRAAMVLAELMQKEALADLMLEGGASLAGFDVLTQAHHLERLWDSYPADVREGALVRVIKRTGELKPK